MKAVVFDAPGGPEVLRVGEAPDPTPGPSELLVRVRAAGVNRADLLQRMGRYPAPAGASPLLGLEFAGEVVTAGAACTRHRPGDRVMALVTGGAYAELAAVPEATAMPVSPHFGWEQAAAIPEAFLTAWLNLFDLGGLVHGETVLVHAGASGVGSAAIQLVRAVGAKVIATAGTDAKLDLCRALGARVVVHREREDFAAAALAATGGEGVHLVLDFVGAPYFEANLRALRRGGRLVLIGFLGGSQGALDLGPVMRKSLTVRGTTLRSTPLDAKAILVERFMEFAAPRFADGSLYAVVDRTYPFSQAAAAHAHVAANRNLGKVVLLLD
jgi:putative PIG3 family NAD(P)H quinone oxidoreductase